MKRSLKRSAYLLMIITLLLQFTYCKSSKDGGTKKQDIPLARVTFLVGKVMATNGNNTRTVKFGDLLTSGDTIKTDAGAGIEFFIKGQGIVRLAEKTELVLAELGARKTDIKVLKGSTGFFLKKQNRSGEFKVRTPTAVASVRGTTFLVESESADSSRVALFGGKVQVENKRGKALVLDKPAEVVIKANADFNEKSVQKLSPRSLKTIKKLAVFHKNNILEYNALIDELKKDSAIKGLEVSETVTGRYAKLRDEDRPSESLKKAGRADEKLIKKETSGDPIQLEGKKDY